MLLEHDELAQALTGLPDWQVAENGHLARRFQFRDFSTAFGFMTRVAMAAEAMDHHPEWSNVYGRVDVELTTHSAGGLTELDVRLARAMDKMAGGVPGGVSS